MMKSSSSSLWLLFSIVVLYSIQCIHCGIHSSPGEILPPRLEIKINSSANITCRMNLSKFGVNVNSTSLYFEEDDSGNRVPQRDIDIINDTTIVYMLRNATEQNRKYVCKSGTMGIGITHVLVGTAPLNITDFKCRGYDYTYMVCNFTKPHNVIQPQYHLSYTAQSPFRTFVKKDKNGKRIYRTTYSQNYIQICNLEMQQHQGICNLTKDTNNYRPNYEFFNFTLTGENDVGVNVQSFLINNYESVIPPKPVYTFEKITTDSVVIKWYIPKYSFYTAKGLEFEIRLRPKGNGMSWAQISDYEKGGNSRSEYKLKVRNLPFAHVWYDISLRLRVNNSARNDDDYWSEPYIQEFQTLACPPKRAPKTDAGSFYIDSSETNVRLYWKQLEHYEENGPDFEYVIKEIRRDGDVVSMNPLHIDRSSAVFPWHRNHNYTFTIKSRNAEGESPDNSTIFIPAWSLHHDRSYSPQWIRNVYYRTNRTHTLYWSPPTNLEHLIDYTVFWCQSQQVSLTECEETVLFKRVNKTSTSFNMTLGNLEKYLNLAVSANYPDFNTGMHWTMCAADVNTQLDKVEPETIDVKSRSITVQWGIDRVCLSLLEGYRITYCRINRSTSSNHSTDAEQFTSGCLENPITMTIPNTAKKYTLQNLNPFSSYKIEINMFSKLYHENISDAFIVDTTEEAPSKPLNLRAHNITSNSALLTWMQPEHHNGILRKYKIEYNNEHHTIDCLVHESRCNHQLMKYKLENLSSYTTYKVYIRAYTTAASDYSNDITVDTLVGIPSNPRHIQTNDKSKSQKILQWSRPEVPSGRVEFYEVAISVWYNDQLQREHISGVVGVNECIYNTHVCLDRDYRFTIKVRAVNVVQRDTEIDHNIFAAKNLTSDDREEASTLTSVDYNKLNNDLKCVGMATSEEKQLAIIRGYRNTQKYVQYKSVWEKGEVTNCTVTEFSRITMLALLVVVSSLGVMAAFYVARNKYHKMSDISCALPPGLEAMAYPTKDSNGDGGDFRRSKDSFYNNESRRLLSSISHDSGYACNNGDLNNGGLHGITGSLGKSSGYIGSDHYKEYCAQETLVAVDGVSSDSCVINQTPVVDDAYMVMELLKPNDNKLSTSSSTTAFDNLLSQSDNNGGYVQPSLSAIAALSGAKSTAAQFSNTQLPSSFMPTDNGYIEQIPLPSAHTNKQMIPSENGYIKPNNLFNWPLEKIPQTARTPTSVEQTAAAVERLPINSCGYVAPQLLQKSIIQPSSDGYTSLEALSKSLKPSQSTISQTFINPEDGAGDIGFDASTLPPISGYVTQKELSAFGQQQHKQQQQQQFN